MYSIIELIFIKDPFWFSCRNMKQNGVGGKEQQLHYIQNKVNIYWLLLINNVEGGRERDLLSTCVP